MKYTDVDGSVCAPKGYAANGIHCGIRKNASRKDLALIVSSVPAAAAAVYTTNRVKAASLLVTKEHLAGGALRAIVCNSGNANACTGAEGLATAKGMAAHAAAALGLDATEVAVGSTGVIGVPLPLAPVEKGMSELVAGLRADAAGADAALAAIMTTDTREKKFAFTFDCAGVTATIGGIVKGAGMIHPSMATMLGFLTCDLAVESAALDAALKVAVKRSFNRVSVDGDTSTNDCVIIMANGMAGNDPVALGSPGYTAFEAALTELCVRLAREVARDGEGASHLLSCTVSGAADEATAETLAKSIISSSLVKAAFFGADANWGRILCAMGYSGADFDPQSVDVAFKSAAGEIAVCRKGASLPFDEEVAKKVLLENEVEILVKLDTGAANAVGTGNSVAAANSVGSVTAWGCDLTYDYVKINGDYRS